MIGHVTLGTADLARSAVYHGARLGEFGGDTLDVLRVARRG